MKNREKNSLKWILGMLIVLPFLIFGEMFVTELISKGNSEIYRDYMSTMLLITVAVYVVIAIVKLVQYQNWIKEYEKKALEEAKSTLDSEFKIVLLNNSRDIPENRFECQAKLGTDGKIICKIQVDYEKELDGYEEFLEYFHFCED